MVWTGNSLFTSDWKGWVALQPSCFTEATSGKLLRLKFRDLKQEAVATICKKDWTAMPGISSPSVLSGNHVDFTITPTMLALLQAEGCIVQGSGFTLTSAEIISKDEVSKLRQTVPVDNDWLWTPPATPIIKVIIDNPTAVATTAHVELIIRTAKLEPYTTLETSVNIGAGQQEVVPFQITPQPGFYECTALVNDELARTFTFGYAPEYTVSPPDMQSDFLSFWQKAKAELAATPLDINMSMIPSKSTAKRHVFLVEVRSASDQTGEVFMRAYYAEPTGSGTYPALIHFMGHDNGTQAPYCMNGDDMPLFAEMYVSIRGQFINNRPPYTNPYGSDYFSYGFGSKEDYYFRGAYLDALRAVDFLCTREKVQKQNIFAEGSSQGGSLAIAAAALSDGRVSAIAPSVFALSDFPDYFQLTPWPGTEAKEKKRELGMTDEEMYSMLSYFDAKNMATMITCPVFMNYSLQDDMCPPSINWAFYNNVITKDKKYLTNPTLGHQIAENWWEEFLRFFGDHIKTEGIESTQSVSEYDESFYTLDGRKLQQIPTRPGIYVNKGKKVVIK